MADTASTEGGTPKTVAFKNADLQEGFTQVPNAIMRDPTLSVGARFTYGLLTSYAWEDETCFPGQARLSKEVGVSDRALRGYIEELGGRGLVVKKRRGMGRTNLYRLLTPQEAANSADQDRNSASGQERNGASDTDRKPASDEEDTGKKTQEEEDEDTHLRVGKRAVSAYEQELCREIVGIFNEVFGTSATFEANYEKVVQRIREEPDLGGADHRRIIEAVFGGHHWWAKSGAPGLGVIYGSRQQFERAIDTAAGRPGADGSTPASIYDQHTEVAKV